MDTVSLTQSDSESTINDSDIVTIDFWAHRYKGLNKSEF